jgi:hypothetical protein
MTATTNPSRNLPANGEVSKREDQFLSPRIVAREAAKIMAAKGIEVRPAALRRLVTRFIRHGHTTLAELERLVITYADPTGEAAVRRVMSERGY